MFMTCANISEFVFLFWCFVVVFMALFGEEDFLKLSSKNYFPAMVLLVCKHNPRSKNNKVREVKIWFDFFPRKCNL